MFSWFPNCLSLSVSRLVTDSLETEYNCIKICLRKITYSKKINRKKICHFFCFGCIVAFEIHLKSIINIMMSHSVFGLVIGYNRLPVKSVAGCHRQGIPAHTATGFEDCGRKWRAVMGVHVLRTLMKHGCLDKL